MSRHTMFPATDRIVRMLEFAVYSVCEHSVGVVLVWPSGRDTNPKGGWRVVGDVEYAALLREAGYDAVSAIINETVAKKNGSRERHGARRAP